MAFSVDGLVKGVQNVTGINLADQATNAAKAFFGNEYLRDYTHASKTFIPNNYAYAPKFKHLFHVYFDINTAQTEIGNNWPQDANFSLAVKSVQLPKFSIDTHNLNQYNRKRLVQTRIKYDQVGIKFHDDNNNLIRKLWHAYYTYYYKDAAQIDQNTSRIVNTAAACKVYEDNRNIYDPSIANSDDWGYIGEGNPGITSNSGLPGHSKLNFFKSINIFGFHQHNFVMYKLVNPIISSFSHDQYAYSETGTMENDMTIEYETVKYFEGALNGQNPGAIVSGFGSQSNYDTRPSPLNKAGSNATILGQGGAVDAVDGIINDISSGNWAGAIQKAGTAYNTFDLKNGLGKVASIAKGEAGAALVNQAMTPSNRGGWDFPTAATTGFNNAVNKGIDVVKGAGSSTSGQTQPAPVSTAR